jgi:hypothetical protein
MMTAINPAVATTFPQRVGVRAAPAHATCRDHAATVSTTPPDAGKSNQRTIEAALRLHPAGPGGGGGPAALPRPLQRLSGRDDEIASMVSYTSICRSHDVTEFSAPTPVPSR